MLLSASTLSYQVKSNNFVVKKHSYDQGTLSCLDEEIIPAQSGQTSAKIATILDDQLIVLSNNSDKTIVQIFDIAEETWSENIAIGPNLGNMTLLTSPGELWSALPKEKCISG
jgi:hypothetical protein